MKEEIDNGIKHLIKELNDLAFKTVYSCSGLNSDHKEYQNGRQGYIAFIVIKEKEEIIRKAAYRSGLRFFPSGYSYYYDIEEGRIKEGKCDKRCIINTHIPLLQYKKTKENIKKLKEEDVDEILNFSWNLFLENIIKELKLRLEKCRIRQNA